MEKPNKSNLWIGVYQATGLSEHHHQRDYLTHFSPEEPTLFPLDFYDDYPDDLMLQVFKQINQFVRTDHNAQQFDGQRVEHTLSLNGLSKEVAETILSNQGFEIVPSETSDSVIIAWINHIVPNNELHLLEETRTVAVTQLTKDGKLHAM